MDDIVSLITELGFPIAAAIGLGMFVWKLIKYLAAMVYNVNAQKRSQMIDPEKLFSLPQDIYAKMEKERPKSTRDQYDSFMEKVKASTFNKKLKM